MSITIYTTRMYTKMVFSEGLTYRARCEGFQAKLAKKLKNLPPPLRIPKLKRTTIVDTTRKTPEGTLQSYEL